MRILTLLLFCIPFGLSLNAQDGLKLKIDGADAFQIHENENGAIQFDVFQNSTFFGRNAGLSTNLTSTSGRYNSFFGQGSGQYNTDGEDNTFIGFSSGFYNTTGSKLTYIGMSAGVSSVSTQYNTAIGYNASYYNEDGDYNVCIGANASLRNTAGSYNTILGYSAGRGSSAFSASGNVFIGHKAGYYETESNRLYIDNSDAAEPLLYGEFNNNELEINGDLTIDVPVGSSESRSEIKFNHENTNYYTIDYDGTNDRFEIRDGTFQVMIFENYNLGIKRTPTTNDLEVSGTASKSSSGDWLSNSDARLKKNITPLNSSLVLDKLLQLKGITYEWNDKSTGYERPEGEQYGFTAQNIQEVFPELVSTDSKGYLQTAYGTYDAMYIEAIRALNEKIEMLEQRLSALEGPVSTASN